MTGARQLWAEAPRAHRPERAGGISFLTGIDKSSVRGLDIAVRGFPLTHENAKSVFRRIAAVEADDDFKFVRTEDIRKSDAHRGIMVHLLVNYEKISSPVTVDVTTGDRIKPGSIGCSYPLMLDDRTLSLMAYPLPAMLAEKLETVISHGVANTHSRNYYDLHILWLTRRAEVSSDATILDVGGLRAQISWITQQTGRLPCMGCAPRLAHDTNVLSARSERGRSFCGQPEVGSVRAG